jgi:PAS domain S-box-containing protein
MSLMSVINQPSFQYTKVHKSPAVPDSNMFKKILEEMPHAFYTCDQFGYINFYNTAAVKLWGREPVIGEDLWCGSWRIFDKKGSLISLDNCPMAICIKEQRPVIGETIVVQRTDGVKRLVAPRPQPLFNAKGKFTGACNMLIDITDFSVRCNCDESTNTMSCVAKDATVIRNTETLTYHSDPKLIALLQNSADIISVIDANAVYSFVSGNVKRIFGYNEVHLIGKNAFEYIHPDDVPVAFKQFQELLKHKSGVQIASFRFLHADGGWRWVETTASNLLNDPVIKGIVINSREVTERKLSELLLKESRDRYDLVAKATNDIIWDWDLASNNIYRSEKFKNFFDNTYDNNSFDCWLDNIHESDKERVINNFVKYLENRGTTCWEDEYQVVKPDGKVAFIHDRGYMLKDETGKVVRMVGAMKDITDKKLAEIEKAKIMRDLIHRNKELEQFTYIVSHNLRAPVANIIGFTHELASTCEADVRAELLSSLSASASKLDKVIRDLNDILQTKDEGNQQKESVTFSSVISDIKICIQNSIKELNVSIETDFSEAEGLFTVKSYLYSMFYNFISNSIKFRMHNRQPVINIRSLKAAGGVQLVISDNGTGIDLANNEEKIFDLNSRLNTTAEGKGMGLFMTKTQIESLGGQIKMSSEVNKGTTFHVFLPQKSSE